MTFRWLVSLASWLDRRFPPKVTVTNEVFEALQAKEHRHSKEIGTISGEVLVIKSELRAAEKSIAALKEFIANGSNPVLAEMTRRARFISEGRMADPAVPGGA